MMIDPVRAIGALRGPAAAFALAWPLLTGAPALAQSSQNIPTGSIFFQPMTPPSTPKVHPYVPPPPLGRGRASIAALHLDDDAAGFSGSSMPPAYAAEVSGSSEPTADAQSNAMPMPLLGFTTDCNAVSGGTASGRTSTTTALDCVASPGAGGTSR